MNLIKIIKIYKVSVMEKAESICNKDNKNNNRLERKVNGKELSKQEDSVKRSSKH